MSLPPSAFLFRYLSVLSIRLCVFGVCNQRVNGWFDFACEFLKVYHESLVSHPSDDVSDFGYGSKHVGYANHSVLTPSTVEELELGCQKIERVCPVRDIRPPIEASSFSRGVLLEAHQRARFDQWNITLIWI